MFPLLVTAVLLVLIVVLIYVFLIWNFEYWNKLGIKTAKSYPFVGSFPSQFTQKRNRTYDVHDAYCKYKKTDNFVGVINCRLPQLLILNPEYVHKVFVNDFRSFHDNEFSRLRSEKYDKIFSNNIFMLTGEQWKERRAEITPGLTPSRVSSVYPVTLEVCKNFVNFIKKQQKMATSDGIDTKQISLCFTTEVVSDCVLGISARSFTDNPTPIANMIRNVFDSSFGFLLYASISNLLPQIRKIYVVPFFKKSVVDFLCGLMKTSIELRRKTQDKTRIDFLNYILELQDKKHLSNDELTSHTVTFLTDGFETTASVLAHALLLLARNPETQQKLLEEIGQAPLSFEKIHSLPYLEAVIHESMRLFPPQLFARKLCTKPYELVNKDGVSITLQPGDVVILPSYSLHHDPDIYEDPEAFKPERFLEENGGVRKYRDMGAYLGFGDGPRICPGIRFALTQIMAAIVDIVRNFEVKVNPKTRKDNELNDTSFLGAIKGGIWLDFKERSRI